MLNLNLLERRLLNKTFIKEIYYLDEISSTNDFAKSIKDKDNVLVLTDHQTAGKGRFNRKWESRKGANLTFTILKKFKIDESQNQIINFFFSYFLLRGIKEFLLRHIKSEHFPQIGIKWPNDIMLDFKKISGILIEHSVSRKTYIVGIGVNVNQSKFDPEYSDKTTSLRNFLGVKADPNELLLDIISNIDEHVHLICSEQFDTIFSLWQNSNLLIGKEVLFDSLDSKVRKARIIGLNVDGSIKVQIEKQEKVYTSGDIKILSFTGDNYEI